MNRKIFVFYRKLTIPVIVGFLFLTLGIAAYYVRNQPTNNVQSHSSAVAPASPSTGIVPTPTRIVPTSNIRTTNEDENIKSCVTDKGAYIGNCGKGYTCFKQGNDQGCSRGLDCSEIKFDRVGDNKCHKICQSNEECSSGHTCIQKEVWRGDYSEMYKLCL